MPCATMPGAICLNLYSTWWSGVLEIVLRKADGIFGGAIIKRSRDEEQIDDHAQEPSHVATNGKGNEVPWGGRSTAYSGVEE